MPAVVHKERTLEGKMSNRCQGADNCSVIAFALYELSSIMCYKTWLFCTFSLVPVDEPNCQKKLTYMSVKSLNVLNVLFHLNSLAGSDKQRSFLCIRAQQRVSSGRAQ